MLDSDLDIEYDEEVKVPKSKFGGGFDQMIETIYFQSNGFDKDPIDKAIEDRMQNKLNRGLTRIENEIYLAVKYGDAYKLKDLGAGEQVDVNFKIEIEKG